MRSKHFVHYMHVMFPAAVDRLTCVQTSVDVIRVERVMKLVGGAANQIVGTVSHQLSHPGNRGEENISRICRSARCRRCAAASGRPTCPRSV